MSETIEIEICERTMDYWIDDNGVRRPKYHVQVKGQPGIWSCGRSVPSAIGDLIMSHSEKFSVQFNNLGKLSR